MRELTLELINPVCTIRIAQVYMFLSKKRAEGKPYFVYMTAIANKFLRVYYGKVNEYLDSIEEK